MVEKVSLNRTSLPALCSPFSERKKSKVNGEVQKDKISNYIIKFISRATRHGKASAQVGHRLGRQYSTFLSQFTNKSFLFLDKSG